MILHSLFHFLTVHLLTQNGRPQAAVSLTLNFQLSTLNYFLMILSTSPYFTASSAVMKKSRSESFSTLANA